MKKIHCCELRFLLAFLATLIPIVCWAHDHYLHLELSRSAFRSSDGVRAFLAEALGAEFAPYDTTTILRTRTIDVPASRADTPMEWLAYGSYQEDMQDPPLLGIPGWHVLRVSDHFYSVVPLRQPGGAPGLTDFTETGGVGPNPINNSFVWATTPGLIGPALEIQGHGISAGPNVDTWWNARQDQYGALTFAQKTDREAMLALMLYALGHVIHLNQDLSQPGHVRNDQHIPGHQAIENHGKKILAEAKKSFAVREQWFPLRPHGWPYWRDAGFTKLLHFWDRGLYLGTASPLDHDAKGDAGWRLGLAEFSNGNFLSEDATYPETVVRAIHSFPFPSRNTSTTYSQIRSQISFGDVDPMDYPDGTSGNRVYLRKIADGIRGGIRHSVLPYLATMRLNSSPPSVVQTYTEGRPHINDPNVLNDYHAILLPKAIEYSAGILDYFFRGRFGCVLITRDSQSQQWTITVQNVSGEAFSGGAFTVMTEDANGTRTQILQSPLTGTLADGASIQTTLPSSLTPNTKCIVVYKGTIGLTGGNASDPVDAGLAVVVKKFTLTTAPDWSQMSWDTAEFGGGASASGYASGESVQFNLVGTTDESSSAYADAHGSLCYTGPGATCKIRINIDRANLTTFGLMIVQDSNIVLWIQNFELTEGEYEFDFTIAGGVNSIIEVGGTLNEFFAPPWLMGLGLAGDIDPGQETLPGALSVSLTLSNQ